MKQSRQILVLGVGNVLMSDEGAGVYAVRKLEQTCRFSENVALLDGGTLGMRLLYPISNADHLIVADAAVMGLTPGTVSRFTIDDIGIGTAAKNSMHQLSFTETLAAAEMVGILPETVIISIEPDDIKTMSIRCTPKIAAGIDTMCSYILEEICAAGGEILHKGMQETVSSFS